MGPTMVAHWQAWCVVVALLMLGAWMRMGSYLFLLGCAALLALAEAILRLRLRWQLASFVVASVVLTAVNWAVSARRARRASDQISTKEA